MVNWLIATFLPRTFAGEISAMYIGHSIDAIPTPIPAAKRISIKKVRPGENAIAMEETAKIKAASIRPRLRADLSANLPAIKQPAIHPKAKEPVKKPSHQASSINCTFRNGKAPDITAKSNPNK